LLLLTIVFDNLRPSFVTADGLDEIRTRGTLIWGADQEGGGPFVFPAADDPTSVSGFEVELAQLIADELGVRPEFAQNQWDKLPDLLARGDIDIVLNGYEWTPDRSQRYGTSVPYYIYELQLLARADDTTLKSWQELQHPADGRKRKVSVLGGSAAQDYLEQVIGDRIEPVLFEGATDALRATELNIDGVDANLQDLPIWTYYANGFPLLKPVGDPVGRGYYVALVRRDEDALLKRVNSAILNALQTGALRRIYEKYGMWNRTQAQRAIETSSDGQFMGDEISSEQSTRTSAAAEESYSSLRGFGVIQERGRLLLMAAGMTVALAVTAMPIAVLIGLLLALARLFGHRIVQFLSTLYVELVRGTPLVLQLYVIFFLLPEIGISIHAFWAAVLGLAINYSAYEAEIYRAGLQAIPAGQMEAALSLGMSRGLALRRIIVPQATRLVIPPVTNDFIALFKDTAVCSVITVVELSKQYSIQARSTGAVIELGLLTAGIYFAMSYPLSILAGRLERRLTPERKP
jgi:polar amino acid transport system substrate-binding protein